MTTTDKAVARIIMRAALSKFGECICTCPGLGGEVDSMNLRAMIDSEHEASPIRQATQRLESMAESLSIDASDEVLALATLGRESESLSLEEAIDSFPVLIGFREGTAYTAASPRRLYIDNPETFVKYASRHGSGAQRCAQFLCSLCGFQVGQFNLAHLRAKLDSEHARAAVAIFERYITKGGF